MTKLVWGEDSKRSYETGIDRGVLYPNTGPGVSWNGLTSIVETPSDSEALPLYVDGVKCHNRQSSGSFSATLSAFTYPDEFSTYDGTIDTIIMHQRRKSFGLCYRTKIGNNVDGYKIHLIYNVMASPSEKDYHSTGESEEPTLFSWGITTTPMSIKDARDTAHLIVDTTKASGGIVTALENILYGTDVMVPTLPSIKTMLELFEADVVFMVTDNGDGTFTVTGSSSAIQILDPSTGFQISWASVTFIDETSYQVSSQ